MVGNTGSGRDWCVKALHPSDPLTEVRGIPDESAAPSLFMNYQTVSTISPQAGSTGTWELTGTLLPHPLTFGAYNRFDSTGVGLISHDNSQIPGVTAIDRLTSWTGQFKRWRLAYASVTIYQDGPDLANQGTVVVCQKPIQPFVQGFANLGGPAPPGIPGTNVSQESSCVAAYPVLSWATTDYPDYDTSQSMPNSYFGRSREGAYVPLKLSRTHQKWHGINDLNYVSGSAPNTYASAFGGTVVVPLTGPSPAYSYPFFTTRSLTVDGSVNPAILNGDLTPGLCNDAVADICFKNLSVQTSLSFFYRFGFECQVTPASPMAPHLKLSPPSDARAVEAYFAISRELKDGYPADFNDLGKIWDVISGIAKSVGPMLSAIPVVGPALAMAVPGAAAVGDTIRASLSRAREPTLGSTVSAADIERIREMPVQAQPARKKKVKVPKSLRISAKRR